MISRFIRSSFAAVRARGAARRLKARIPMALSAAPAEHGMGCAKPERNKIEDLMR
jgi:hypothetical protein